MIALLYLRRKSSFKVLSRVCQSLLGMGYDVYSPFSAGGVRINYSSALGYSML